MERDEFHIHLLLRHLVLLQVVVFAYVLCILIIIYIYHLIISHKPFNIHTKLQYGQGQCCRSEAVKAQLGKLHLFHVIADQQLEPRLLTWSSASPYMGYFFCINCLPKDNVILILSSSPLLQFDFISLT